MHDTDDHPWQPYWNDDYSTDNNAGSTYFNLTDGQIMDCQFFDTNYISYFAHDSTRPLARNIFVSGRKGPAASASVPTLAPSTAGTVPTSAPATAETEPTVAPTPSVTTSMRGLKGFDYGLSPTLTASDFDCMVENGFEFFVQRGFVTWNTSHRGVIDIVDPNLCMHLRRAHSAGLDIQRHLPAASSEIWYFIFYCRPVVEARADAQVQALLQRASVLVYLGQCQ
jgi:hypothetical protein